MRVRRTRRETQWNLYPVHQDAPINRESKIPGFHD